MTDDELDLLEKYNGFDKIDNLRRKTEKVYFIIFDDMIGTEAFKNKRKSVSRMHVDWLPDLILENIFSLLSLSDLRNSSLVCKRWYR